MTKYNTARLIKNWILLLSSPLWVLPFILMNVLVDDDFKEVFINGTKSFLDV